MNKSNYNNKEIGKRLKEFRKMHKLKQDEVGKKIGVSGSNISKMELGVVSFTEQTIKALCREYHIGYDWLLTGDGDMVSDLPSSIMDELSKQYKLDDTDRRLIEEYLKLDESNREVLKKYMKNVFGVK